MAALTADGARRLPSEPVADDGKPAADGFERWRRTNVATQKQDGFVAATITIPMGNISTCAVPRAGAHHAQVLRRQRPHEPEPEPRPALGPPGVAARCSTASSSAIGLGEPDADLLADVVACPGADSCKLAITSSNQAGYSMREEMIKFDYADPEVQKVSVKISGCPNGCGQHHLAGIGLQGSSYKVGKLEVPCYDIFVGGARLPGRRPLRHARHARPRQEGAPGHRPDLRGLPGRAHSDSESFVDFVDRVGPKHFEQPLEEFKWVGSLAEEPEMYMDWGHDGPVRGHPRRRRMRRRRSAPRPHPVTSDRKHTERAPCWGCPLRYSC